MISSPDSFDALLDWLDPDREKAAVRYEIIRAGLIRIFASKGLSDAEHYTDETIDRVIKRLPELRRLTLAIRPVTFTAWLEMFCWNMAGVRKYRLMWCRKARQTKVCVVTLMNACQSV